jgi:hypothetical protein
MAMSSSWLTFLSDSKSSSGTQSFTGRPYQPGHYGGSSSTLPSSAESDLNDNMFSGLPPRPHVPQHNSSPSLSLSGFGKHLPPVPNVQPTKSTRYYNPTQNDSAAASVNGRARALTTSSYASTAIPPKLETDLDFGNAGFDDMFSGLERKPSGVLCLPDGGHTKQSPSRSIASRKLSHPSNRGTAVALVTNS